MPDIQSTTTTADANTEPPYGMIVVMTGLVAVAAVAIVAMFQYPNDATMVVTALGPVIGVIGTLVGAYFGLRGSLGWARWERSGPEVELHSAHPAWATAPTRTLRVAGAQNAGYGDGQGQAALRNFVAAARGEAQPVFTVDDALRILEVLDAAQRSSASGERVRLG